MKRKHFEQYNWLLVLVAEFTNWLSCSLNVKIWWLADKLAVAQTD